MHLGAHESPGRDAKDKSSPKLFGVNRFLGQSMASRFDNHGALCLEANQHLTTAVLEPSRVACRITTFFSLDITQGPNLIFHGKTNRLCEAQQALIKLRRLLHVRQQVVTQSVQSTRACICASWSYCGTCCFVYLRRRITHFRFERVLFPCQGMLPVQRGHPRSSSSSVRSAPNRPCDVSRRLSAGQLDPM